MTVPQGPTELLACQPGDVIVVRTGGLAAEWIRFGAAVRGWPNLENHVAIIAYVDATGIVIAIEGRPGGVGKVDAAQYFAGSYGKYTLTNRKQPKTAEQRSVILSVIEKLLKTDYDWDGIAEDALNDLRIPDLWAEKWKGTSPAHVVCSSLASWAYHTTGLAAPTQEDMRHIQPANWAQFIIEGGWN